MSVTLLIMLLLGLYLTCGLIISAYRQALGKSGGQGMWVLLWAIVFMGLAGLWLPESPSWSLSMALVWLAGTLGLIRLGVWLRSRTWPARMVWLLGPMHALGLMGTYLRDLRREVTAVVPTGEDVASDEPAHEAFESVVELGETTLEEVMVPRSELAYLEATQTVKDWLDVLGRRGHRVFPVCGQDLDDILGCVHIADLFADRAPDQPVREFLREARFVPETMRCDDLLREMIARGDSLAIVVDEFGGTAGVITDHDLIEILLGEINRQNPFEGRIITAGDGEYVTDGHYRIDDFNAWSDSPLPEGDYETIAGLLLEESSKIPSEGEKIVAGGFEFEVIQATERRIQRVRVRMPERVRADRAANGNPRRQGQPRGRANGPASARRVGQRSAR